MIILLCCQTSWQFLIVRTDNRCIVVFLYLPSVLWRPNYGNCRLCFDAVICHGLVKMPDFFPMVDTSDDMVWIVIANLPTRKWNRMRFKKVNSHLQMTPKHHNYMGWHGQYLSVFGKVQLVCSILPIWMEPIWERSFKSLIVFEKRRRFTFGFYL